MREFNYLNERDAKEGEPGREKFFRLQVLLAKLHQNINTQQSHMIETFNDNQVPIPLLVQEAVGFKNMSQNTLTRTHRKEYSTAKM
jgi:hypothetical protein